MCLFFSVFTIIALYTVGVCASIRSYSNEGNSCVLKTGGTGICRDYEDCPSAKLAHKTQKNYPIICRFKSGINRPIVPIVCCDETQKPVVSQPIKKPSLTGWTSTTNAPLQNTRITPRKCRVYLKWIPKNDPKGNETIKEHTPILGGKKALPKEFPHMVRLGFGHQTDRVEQLTWECGGSLLTNKFVLTAAHCLINRQNAPVHSVYAGYGDRTKVEIRKVIRRIPHPNYQKPFPYNDIAILELEKSFPLNDYIRPTCLQTEKKLDKKRCLATGWGVTETAKSSKDLLRVKLPLITGAECSVFYKKNILLQRGIDDETMLCAGDADVPKDTCNGDSGGPLQISLKKPTCNYTIIGITSFGAKCGHSPGVYTRVSAFIPWIDSVICP